MTVEWDVDEIKADVKKAINKALFIGAELIKTKAVDKITSGPKTGLLYRRRGVTHQASAPGEAPASDIGTLVGRSQTTPDFENSVVTVKFSTAYAAALEFGSDKIEARPFLRPSLVESREEIENSIRIGIVEIL